MSSCVRHRFSAAFACTAGAYIVEESYVQSCALWGLQQWWLWGDGVPLHAVTARGRDLDYTFTSCGCGRDATS